MKLSHLGMMVIVFILLISSAESQETKRRAPVRKESYPRSRLTVDQTEAEADRRQLVLAAGVDKIVDLDPSFEMSDQNQRIMIGNSSVVQVVPATIGTQKQLIFKPVAEGETNVTVRDKAGHVRIIFDVFVAKQNQIRFLERLKANLKEVEGITIGLEDKNIVIRGEVLTTNDYGLIINEIGDKTYGDSVINKAQMSPVTIGFLAKKIEADLQAFAPTVKATVINGKIVLDGSVDSEAIKQRCFKRAYWYLPAVRVKEPIASAGNVEAPAPEDKNFFMLQNDISVVPPPPKRESKLVRLAVYFVELNKDFLKSFGFKWQPGFTADPTIQVGSNTAGGVSTTSSNSGFSFSATLTSLFPSLNAPPSNASYGRILKSATAVVKSAEKAHVKDEINLPTQTLGQNGTAGIGAPITVGFDMNVTPTILQGQDIEVDVALTQKNQVGKAASGTAIVANHEVNTKLYLKSGETSAVAAVNKQDVSTSFNRDDANSGSFQGGAVQTRPLFTFQRSKNMSKAKGQFVVFINPTIIESASEGTEDLKKNFRMTSSTQ